MSAEERLVAAASAFAASAVLASVGVLLGLRLATLAGGSLCALCAAACVVAARDVLRNLPGA